MVVAKKFIEGFNNHRIMNSEAYYDGERYYLNLINSKLKRNKNFLNNIVGKECNERELKILVTFIQWLGTPVGQEKVRDDTLAELKKNEPYNNRYYHLTQIIFSRHADRMDLSEEEQELIIKLIDWLVIKKYKI